MKKKLNEIFDEAKPQELDQFSDELNAPKLPDDVLASVKDKFYVKTKLKKEKKTTQNIWIRFGAIAACLLLIVSAVIVVPMVREDYTPIIFDATVSPEQLNGNSLEFIVGTSTSIEGGAAAEPPRFEFSAGFAVKARVVKNYPDKYYKLDISSAYRPMAYRLIQMETLEVICGNNVPKYFLYLIPDYLYVDMSIYDSLIISMSQLGVENYVLRNGTQNKMESFELLIFSDEWDNPERGNIIAFSDGIFDESLWQNKMWNHGYHYLDHPEHADLVVARGDFESTVISAINQQFEE